MLYCWPLGGLACVQLSHLCRCCCCTRAALGALSVSFPAVAEIKCFHQYAGSWCPSLCVSVTCWYLGLVEAAALGVLACVVMMSKYSPLYHYHCAWRRRRLLPFSVGHQFTFIYCNIRFNVCLSCCDAILEAGTLHLHLLHFSVGQARVKVIGQLLQLSLVMLETAPLYFSVGWVAAVSGEGRS